jgi:hypothetical protein
MRASTSSRFLPAALLFLLAGASLLTALAKHDSGQAIPWIEGWRQLPAFQLPRRALAAVATGQYLYVLGGVDGNGRYVLPVEYAAIHADGSLGPWRQTSSLKEGRFYLAAAAHGGYLYALGGGGGALGDDNVPLASVEKAPIHADGSLGPWSLDSYLTTPRRGLKVALAQDRLYAIGGYNGSFLKSTERLDLSPTASTHEWRLEPEAAVIDRYIHSAALLGQRLFVLGGHVQKAGPMSYGDVESARINADGSLAPWQVAQTRLQVPRFIASAFAYGNYLYIAGGHNGARRLASVEMAAVGADGRVGPWTFAAPLQVERSAAAAAVHGHHVYVLGGISNRAVLATVETAAFGPNGRLGKPAAGRK